MGATGAEAGATTKGNRGVSRRAFAIGGASALVLAGSGFLGMRGRGDASVLRPPGGQDPDAFLRRCVRCERCREVCPHHAVAPLGLEAGLACARTPTMDFYQGWCNFCEDTEDGLPLCARFCPTGALDLAGLDSPKDQVVIGTAAINREWCLAWQGRSCRVCVDACPYDALEFDDSQRPVVREDRCNGCGRCENVCISLTSASVAPNATWRAIRVAADGRGQEGETNERA